MTEVVHNIVAQIEQVFFGLLSSFTVFLEFVLHGS